MPEKFKSSIIATFGVKFSRQVLHLLEKNLDYDNFKIYCKVITDILSNTNQWKEFLNSDAGSIYTSDYHLKTPFNDPLKGQKHTPLTYSEISNIIFLFRPHELANYLLGLSKANQYMMSRSLVVYGKLPFSLSLSSLTSYSGEENSLSECIWEPEKRKDVSHKYSKTKDVSELARLGEDTEAVFNEDCEIIIKDICLHFLNVQSGVYFNTYSDQSSHDLPILESLEKVNADFSKPSLKRQDTASIIGGSKGYYAVQEISNNIDVISSLISHTNQRVQTLVDENRTILVVYTIFAVILKSLEIKRKVFGAFQALNAHDVVSITNSLMRIILPFSKQNSTVFIQAVDLLFYQSSEASLALLPLLSSNNIIHIFNENFKEIFDSNSQVLEKGNEFYRFKIPNIARSYPEIFTCISNFPSRDPPSLFSIHDRELTVQMRKESFNLFRNLRNLDKKDLLKVNFTVESKTLDSKGRPHFSNKSEPLHSYKSWSSYLSRKICLVMIVNLISAPLMIDLENTPLVKHLIGLKMKQDGVEEDHVNEDKPDIQIQIAHPGGIRLGNGTPSSKRKTIKANPRVSLLQNFRLEMKKRYSSRNRQSVMRTSEIRDSIKGGIGNSIRNSGVIVNQVQNGQTGRNSGKNSLAAIPSSNKKGSFTQKPSGRFSIALAGSLRTGGQSNPLIPFELDFIEIKGWNEDSRKLSHKMGRVYQSQGWIEMMTMNRVNRILKEITAQKFEIYSGEIRPCYSDSEEFILTEDPSLEMNKHPDQDDFSMRSIFLDKIPDSLRASLPVDYPCHYMTNSFSSFWEGVTRRISYVQEMTESPDCFPKTGSYDLSRIFRPASVLLNTAVHHALKYKVTRF